MQSQNYFITGASGFIGKRLCETLKQQDPNQPLKVLMRNPNSGPWDEVTLFDFKDIEHQALPSDLTKNTDTVFHLAGIAHTGPSSSIFDQRYHTVNVKATEKLLENALQNGVKHFIYVSSIKAIHPQDPYGLSKQAAEKIVLEYGRARNMQVCILRPVLVYGPGVKGNLFSLLKGIDQGWFPPIPETYNRRSLISVDDLVQALLLVSKSDLANGKIYTITDGEVYSTKQLYDGMRLALGKKPSPITCPLSILKAIARLGDGLQKIFSCNLPINSQLFEKLFESAVYEDNAIQKELGWTPKDNFYKILPNMVSTYRQSSSKLTLEPTPPSL